MNTATPTFDDMVTAQDRTFRAARDLAAARAALARAEAAYREAIEADDAAWAPAREDRHA